MQVDIRGKVAVITGPGRGIGEGLAHRFAKEGARLVLLERDAESLSRVAAALKDVGAEVEACVCDVSIEEQVTTVVERGAQRFRAVDVLVNNAGVGFTGTVEQLSVRDWEETFAVNTQGVFLCSRAVIPYMRRQRSGRILNASSFAAIVPSFAFSSYAASKAAVASFTRVLAAELGPWNITVNAYAPGMIPTALNRFAEAPPERQKLLLDTLALRRWGSAEDIASLLIFLASDMASYITGALIDISGGKFSVQFPQMAYEQERPV